MFSVKLKTNSERRKVREVAGFVENLGTTRKSGARALTFKNLYSVLIKD